MNCHEVRLLAPLYLSAELDAQRRCSCDLHLSSCPACEEIFEQQQICDARLVAALDRDLPEMGSVEKINQYVRSHITAVGPEGSRKQRWLVPGALAASLVAATVGIFTLMVPSAPPAYTAAAKDHWAEVVEHQPRHWRSTPAELQALMTRTGFSLSQAAALAAPGYWLEHAKTCGIAGRRALHLVFTNGAQQYSLYLRPEDGPKSDVRLIRQNTETIAGFDTGHLSVLLVTTGTSTQCKELAYRAAAIL